VLALLPLHVGVSAPVSDDAGALFDVGAARPSRPGRVLSEFRRVVAAAREAGTLLAEDDALIAGVEVMAEALDTARAVGGLKGGYLAAQAFPPYQRGCHALRLPVELTAATPPVPAPDGHTDTPSWLRDAFGTPE
jgi:hypothetical protein